MISGNMLTRNIPKEIGTKSNGSKPYTIARYMNTHAMRIIT